MVAALGPTMLALSAINRSAPPLHVDAQAIPRRRRPIWGRRNVAGSPMAEFDARDRSRARGGLSPQVSAPRYMVTAELSHQLPCAKCFS